MRRRMLLICGLCVSGLLIAAHGQIVRAVALPAVTKSVLFIADAALPAPARHGVAALEDALRAKQIAISDDPTQLASADVVILARVSGGKPQAVTIRKGSRYRNKPAILLEGGDGAGLMYAALDTADRIGWSSGADPFELVRDTTETPYLERRGVVMFTMNRAYFETRLYDERYLARYLDLLADSRLNQLVVTFGYEDGGYMAPPYPYFFDVDGFPNVKVVGLTSEEQARNRTAFRTLLRMAADRGIQAKVGIWDHIYRGGVQAGGIRGASNGSQPAEGLVWGLDESNLAAFTTAGLARFYQTFPEIAETQFRMHEESGLRQNEIEPFWHEVFGFFSHSKRDMPLELRVKNLPKSVIKDAQAHGLTIDLDTKFWMEQMGLPFHPTHINVENQKEARHSYADLLEYPQTYRMDWTLWNGGTQRLLLWGDPDYVKRVAANARLYDGRTFAVTEMEATKMLGEPPEAPVRDFLNAKYRSFDYEFERYWAFYRQWGRLLYNPDTAPEVWEQEFARRFGSQAAPHVSKALALSSRVLPRIVAASYRYRMFPTTIGWPEMQHMGSLPQFAQQETPTDIAQFMSVRDEAASILAGTETALRRPEETSRWFAGTADAILTEIAAAERALGDKTSPEFNATAADARILAALARYHSWRQRGGVNYSLYRQSGDLAPFDEALANERQAVQAWRDLVAAAGDVYSDNIAFGPAARNFPRHWKDELPALERELSQLETERRNATPRPDARPARIPPHDASATGPAVRLVNPPPEGATASAPFRVRARVTSTAGVKWMRLRYRHVNQMEDYETAEMTLDSRSGLYTATIPDAFITPQWDLMYYVEIVDQRGNGRIFPDLETDTPYVVVRVKR